MASLLEGFRVVRKRLADGSIKEYRYPIDQKKPKARHPQDSVGALVSAYRISQEYLRLAPTTKAGYELTLDEWKYAAGNPVKDITRRQILHMRDAIAASRGPAAANSFISATSVLLAWALDREWITATPATKIKAIEIGNYPAWTPKQAEIALAGLPELMRRAVVLGLHTGQRRGDLVRMRWMDIQGPALRVVQQKTRAKLLIPITPELGEELAAWRKDIKDVKDIEDANSRTILVTKRGRPWIDTYLSREMGAAVQAIGLPAGLNIHGLRKLAASNLAQAGCSTHEIASITGHKSLGMVELYTRSVNQERLAEAAVLRLHKGQR